MATELDCTTTGQNGSNFLDTFQLVESLEDRPPVPNLLLDTKIFRKTGQESKTISASPVSVHFGIISLEKKYSKQLNLMNLSKKLINIQIISPQTKYFKIQYEKLGHLSSGTQMSCKVEFIPTEWRYYYDCIRIHCPEEENVIVPIHAYPEIKNDCFPENYTFPPTPIGERLEKTFHLSSEVPVEFEFQLSYLQSNPAFKVSPMEGIIPGKGQVIFKVTFSPIRFETSIIKLQLSISQFNSKPQFCTLFGSSVPGLEMEKALKKFNEEHRAVLDPHSVVPLDRLRIKKNKSEIPQKKIPQEIEYNGYRFPAEMNTVHAVSKVLNQKANQLYTKCFKNVLWKGKQNDSVSRQVKAVTFENSIQQLIKEERQNQLRWQKKVGDDPMSAESKIIEQEYWKQLWDNYKYRFNHNIQNYFLKTECVSRRTVRSYDEIPENVADFNPYKNNLWPQRLYAKRRFIQAVYKVIIRSRYAARLKIFKEHLAQWTPKISIPDSIDDYQLRERFQEEIKKKDNTIFEDMSSKICSQSFMHTKHSEEKIKNYDTLPEVPLNNTEFITRKRVSYEDLLVPQYYKLQEYEPYDMHEAANCYLYPDPEIYTKMANVALPKHRKRGKSPKSRSPETSENSFVVKALSPVKPSSPVKVLSPSKVDNGISEDILMKFRIPDYMLQHLKNSADNIFNSIPNLLTFEMLLPYSEFDSDFHMCPIPRFPQQNSITQKKFLDRNDVIRGQMTWKKMPSPTLAALNLNPTLREFMLPKYSRYITDEPPPLLEEMPEELTELAASNSTNPLQMSCNVNITPAFVTENFFFISVEQHTECRYYLEDDLQKRIQNESNQLGKRITERVSVLTDMFSDTTLLL